MHRNVRNSSVSAAAFAVALLIAPVAQAAPGDMTVATFLAKANALKARGPLALFSSDFKLLQKEGQAGGMAYRAQLQEERKAGKPSSCPPTPSKIDSEQVMAQMNSYPDAMRGRITVRQAMADLFRKKFPCPK